MKKILKLFSLMLITCLIFTGCEKDEDPNPETPIVDENEQVEKKIHTTEVSMFNGEFNDKYVVLKVQNDNDKPVYLNYSFEMFDKNKIKLYNKEVYVRVGSKDSAYVVAIQDLEEKSFNSYTYTMKVQKDKLEDYDLIKSNIKVDYSNNGKEIIVNLNNIGNRTTTAYALVFFYKNNSLVAVKDATSYNLVPYKVDNISVSYPIKTIKEKISFDKVQVVLNEVSTEL